MSTTYRLFFEIEIEHVNDKYVATSPSYISYDDEGEECLPEFEGMTATEAQAQLLHALADVVDHGNVEEPE